MKKKPASYSETVMSTVMMPNQANASGRNVHGGEIMKLMDTAAYVAATKHARNNVVTARVDGLEFIMPILVGQLVTCKAKIGFVGHSSMEVAVKVEVENLKEEVSPVIALTALFTMVAINEKCRSCQVPGLEIETDEEIKAFEAGRLRYERLKSNKQSSK